MIFHYTCLHPGSKSIFKYEIKFNSRLEFLEALSDWNRLGQGFWIYWETK